MDSSSEEDLLSSTLDLQAKLLPILYHDDMDIAAKKSFLKAEFLNIFKTEDASDAEIAYDRQLAEISMLIVFRIMEEDYIPETFSPTKRDNHLIDVACHAAYRSFELVMEELRQPSAYVHFSAKKTIKCLCKRVLASFDLFCKDLSIESNCDVVNLRGYIQKAADFAKEYISLETDQIQFPEDSLDMTDDSVLWNLQSNLRGNYFHRDTSSEMQQVAKAMDDDIVGLDGDMIKIKEQLTGNLSELKIIPIVGMGGIGKTTLAKRVYEDPQIIVHFHVRAWTIVSQEYHERDVLLSILQSIAPFPEEVRKEDKEQLAERLYRRLRGWKYFIVLDDIWTAEAWDQIKLCFPDDNNGSRIVMTSRITEVASYVSPENSPHFMTFLGLEDSWDLLRKQIFGKEACPSQLVNVGKQIAEKCQGLPLAIKVVAGQLSNISKKQECWDDVAERVCLPTEGSQMESLLNILSMSYNYLPQQLKACFLTMVTFPKNFEIPVRKLVRFWAAMGFLHKNMPNTVEDVATKCLEDLIGRSLIMVKKRKFDGKVKICGIHDLLWDLSMREARKEGNSIFGNFSLSHSYFKSRDDIYYAMGLCSTLLYFDHSFESDCPIGSPEFKLLRVLDIMNQSFDHFPDEITELVNMRYLALATSGNIPESVSKLCNLETLINNHERAAPTLPDGIWSLARLQHLHVGTCTCMVEPPSAAFEGSCVSGLPNLQTLSNLSSASCTKEVLLKIPNLKELRIHETEEEDIEDELLFSSLSNIVYLNQLEIFNLCCNSELEKPRCIPIWDSFIPNIKQLTLVGGHLPWSKINALANLPNLEVLKLKEYACDGLEWEMDDKEFFQLKCLALDCLALVFWNATKDNFPNLQCLVIRDCPGLSGFPMEIGEIPTLQLIDLDFCGAPTFEYARQIQREQFNLGNDKLVVRIGRLVPEDQLRGLVMTFVYMNSRLKMQQAKKVSCKKRKEKDVARKGEVSLGERSSNCTLAALNDDSR